MQRCFAWLLTLTLVLACAPLALAQEAAPAASDININVGEPAGATDSMTIVRPDEGGGVRVYSQEVRTREAAPGAQLENPAVAEERAKAPDAAADEVRKARVVIIPAVMAQEKRRRLDRELNERWGLSDPGIIENPGYTSYLIDALVNTRKFDVLEREQLNQLIREMEFGESEYVNEEQAVKIGNMAGADYVVMPEIRFLETEKESKAVPYVGGEQISLRCKLGTGVRTVDVKTGKIVSSSINDTETRKRERDANAEGSRIAVMEIISQAFKESSLKEAANIVDVAYPIRIMSVLEEYVMLNRGKGAINEGEVLKVYEVGEMMIDPDTKENLGYSENYCGAVRVSEVGQKTSKAAIVDKMAPLKTLSICRRVNDPTAVVTPAAPSAPKID